MKRSHRSQRRRLKPSAKRLLRAETLEGRRLLAFLDLVDTGSIIGSMTAGETTFGTERTVTDSLADEVCIEDHHFCKSAFLERYYEVGSPHYEIPQEFLISGGNARVDVNDFGLDPVLVSMELDAESTKDESTNILDPTMRRVVVSHAFAEGSVESASSPIRYQITPDELFGEQEGDPFRLNLNLAASAFFPGGSNVSGFLDYSVTYRVGDAEGRFPQHTETVMGSVGPGNGFVVIHSDDPEDPLAIPRLDVEIGDFVELEFSFDGRIEETFSTNDEPGTRAFAGLSMNPELIPIVNLGELSINSPRFLGGSEFPELDPMLVYYDYSIEYDSLMEPSRIDFYWGPEDVGQGYDPRMGPDGPVHSIVTETAQSRVDSDVIDYQGSFDVSLLGVAPEDRTTLYAVIDPDESVEEYLEDDNIASSLFENTIETFTHVDGDPTKLQIDYSLAPRADVPFQFAFATLPDLDFETLGYDPTTEEGLQRLADEHLSAPFATLTVGSSGVIGGGGPVAIADNARSAVGTDFLAPIRHTLEIDPADAPGLVDRLLDPSVGYVVALGSFGTDPFAVPVLLPTTVATFAGVFESAADSRAVVRLPAADDSELTVSTGNQISVSEFEGSLGGNDRILIMAGDGEDRITVDPSSTQSFTIVGGPGYDVIESARGDDIILGGADGGQLSSISGSNVIIGGDGVDIIQGGDEDDVLLGDGFEVSATKLPNFLDILSGIFNGDQFQWLADLIPIDGDGDVINGGLGDAIIIGGAGTDFISTDNGNAIIFGDSFEASASIDADLAKLFTLSGFASAMKIAGGIEMVGDGRDEITTGEGNHLIFGGDGNDTITTSNKAETVDLIFAGDGDDTVESGNGYNLIVGGDGDDTLTAGRGDATSANLIFGDSFETDIGLSLDLDALMKLDLGHVFSITGGLLKTTGSGDDVISGGDGFDFIVGGLGADRTIRGFEGTNIVFGDGFEFGVAGTVFNIATSLLNPIPGSTTAAIAGAAVETLEEFFVETVYKTFFGSAGTASASDNGDRYVGGSGTDVFFGGSGNDIAYGYDKNNCGGDCSPEIDLLVGGDGDDNLLRANNTNGFFANGRMIAFGGPGDDVFQGGSGNDILFSTTGRDTFFGQDGDDLIVGGDGEDELFGGGGSDYLIGDGGGDLLDGGDENDTLVAGPGADELVGGDGDDLLIGGGGEDDFVDVTHGDVVIDDDLFLVVDTFEDIIASDDVTSLREALLMAADADAPTTILLSRDIEQPIVLGDPMPTVDQPVTIAATSGSDGMVRIDVGGLPDPFPVVDGGSITMLNVELDNQLVTQVPLNNLGGGVAVHASASGLGHLMFSQQNVHDRLSDHPTTIANADHVMAVQFDASQNRWFYSDNQQWRVFVPALGDRLLAEVDFDGEQLRMFDGQHPFQHQRRVGSDQGGWIEASYAGGDLSIMPNTWRGQSRPDEFGLTGSVIEVAIGPVTSPNDIVDFSAGRLGGGVAVQDDATGEGFLMYSPRAVRDRFSEARIPRANADHWIAVRQTEAGWQFNDNQAWFDFVPEAGDRLVAGVDFDRDAIWPLLGTFDAVDSNGVIAVGTIESDLVFSADVWRNSTNNGEFFIAGSNFSAVADTTEMLPNVIAATDVDGDGDVAPLDALLIINHLRARDLTIESEAELIDDGSETDAFDAVWTAGDVNSDGEIAPLDALLVINQLRRNQFPAGNGHAEPLDSIEDLRLQNGVFFGDKVESDLGLSPQANRRVKI